jgi:hypothetical protein
MPLLTGKSETESTLHCTTALNLTYHNIIPRSFPASDGPTLGMDAVTADNVLLRIHELARSSSNSDRGVAHLNNEPFNFSGFPYFLHAWNDHNAA